MLRELKLIAKNRGIKGYKSISKDELLSIFNTSKPIKNDRKGDKKNTFKSKREEIKISIYKTTRKNLFKSKRRILYKSERKRDERIFLDQNSTMIVIVIALTIKD